MIEVRKPVLLDNNLADSQVLYPAKGSLKLNMTGLSEASLTLGAKSETIPMHAWVKIYNQLGFVGIFRRTGRDNNVVAEKTFTLRHGIDILQDSVWAAQTEFTGTKAEFLTAMLNQQTQLIQGPGDNSPRKPWTLGSCADTSSYTRKINYDNLLTLFNGLVEESGNYYFTYDQTTWPWTVSLVAKPTAVASEFRLSRNIERCKIKDNDSELCTRLILSVNKMVNDQSLADKTGNTVKQNATVIRTYNNTSAQNAGYGIIVKTADIDVTQDTFPNGPFPEADAWAADFLARRAAPSLQVQIDGYILKGITGEDWDESRIGTVCKVSLPDYPEAVAERCVSVTYSDLYESPDKVTVSLANALPSFTKTLSSTQKVVEQQATAGRESSRQDENFSEHLKITDNSGSILKQAGMGLDSNGRIIYASDDERMVQAKIQVEADKVSLIVDSTTGKVTPAKLILAINGNQSEAHLDADQVYIGNQKSTTVINGKLTANDITADFLAARISAMTGLTVASIMAQTITTSGGIYAGSLSVGGTALTSWLVSASVSGDTLTITNSAGGSISFTK